MKRSILAALMVACLGSFALDGVDLNTGKILGKSLTVSEINHINGELGIQDSWAIPASAGVLSLDQGTRLTQVDQGFSEVGNALNPGFYFNHNNFQVRVTYGEKSSFLLPSGASFVVGMLDKVEGESRPFMLQGGARERIEFQDMMSLNPEMISVRSNNDLQSYLGNASNDEVLKGVPGEVLDAFSEGVLFRNGGLAGLNYGILDDVLSDEELDTVLRKFGLSIEYLGARDDGHFDDDKKCDSPGSCMPQPRWSCTSNC